MLYFGFFFVFLIYLKSSNKNDFNLFTVFVSCCSRSQLILPLPRDVLKCPLFWNGGVLVCSNLEYCTDIHWVEARVTAQHPPVHRRALCKEELASPEYQFSSLQSLSRVWLFVTPWLILCRPLQDIIGAEVEDP